MKLTVKELVLMALYAALFVSLDYTSNLLPKMPYGGSVGLGVIPLLVASYHLGWKKGLLVGLISIPLQFITGEIWFVHWIQFLLDYVVAFSAYGIACLFPNVKLGKWDVYMGIVATNLVRYACSVISGIVFWGEQGATIGAVVKYSMGYNATYMIPTLAVTMVLVPLLLKRLNKFVI